MKRISIISLLIFIAGSFAVKAQSFDWAAGSPGERGHADEGSAVCMDADGNSYVTGRFSSRTFTLGTFSLTNTSVTATNPYDAFDMFVAKFDSRGKVLWVIQSDGAGEERGVDIACDKTGHVVVVGIFKGASAKFGTTELRNPNTSAFSTFLMRVNALGNIQWAKWAGGKSSSRVHGVSTGPDGEVYITGEFAQGVTFGGYEYKSKSGNNSSVFVAKYLSNGELKWFEQIFGTRGGGQNSTQVGKAIFATPDSRFVYVTGWFRGRSTFGDTQIASNTEPSPAGQRTNIFITKYDSDGRGIWTKSIGQRQIAYSADPEVTDIVADNQGGVYLTGHFPGILFFGDEEMKGAPSRGKSWNRDIFLAKYDADGNHLWHRSAGGSDNDEAFSIALTSGGVLITGSVAWGDARFGDIKLSPGFPNAFVAHYNGDGKCLSAIAHSTNLTGKTGLSSKANGIATNGRGIVITGQYLGNTIAFGKTTLKAFGAGNFFAAGLK